MKDRDQKQKALRLAVGSRWLPQLEVDVTPHRSVASKAPLVTDLDVYASIPDPFFGYRTAVFDCKTKARESPVNRCLWLAGVLDRLQADQGFCILKKNAIEIDHRNMASRLRIVLLNEIEFDTYASATCHNYSSVCAKVADLDLWEWLFAIPKRYRQLESAIQFLRSTYWMIDDASEACRKTLVTLRATRPELDPDKPEHVAVFFEFCALFSRSLAVVVNRLFKAYLHPANQHDLSEPLLMMLYGGRDAYDHRNSLFKLAKNQSPDAPIPDLALPEWDRFVQLVRQLLDSPLDVQHAPLILREVGFGLLSEDKSYPFVKELCSESPQGGKFALLIPSYLCRASQLPPEFRKIADDAILPQFDVK